ncbi:MAG: DEAD/DEAH box helicase [Bacteroidota bacterium]|nr:MAG: DEAD/DEAH box helicase [Bacteroidota bacterium]
MKFEDYHIAPRIKSNLVEAGFRRPTDIQFKAIPHILNGEDVLAIAQTGTGKTAAFAIPVINNIEGKKNARRPDGIRCIVMVPTHELALQIASVFDQVAKGTAVKTFCIHGGVDQQPQIDMLEKGFDILVATPGRMFDLVSQGHLKLNRVEVLVLDEADHMLDLGFINDIRQLVKMLPKGRQTLFFSATIDESIKKLAYSLVTNPIRIQISPKDPVARNIDHFVTFIKMDDKRFFLERLINENPETKILVFVRTKVRAERVCAAMERIGVVSKTIHGDKEQEQRAQIMADFRTGKTKVLIATDVSARGIDISEVDYVVNYDLPEQTENYVHRVGRTGRGSRRGRAISFCSEEEKSLLLEIENYLGHSVAVLEIDTMTYHDTIAASQDSHADWKTLMREAEEEKGNRRKKKKK